jgi:hypothetical protein
MREEHHTILINPQDRLGNKTIPELIRWNVPVEKKYPEAIQYAYRALAVAVPESQTTVRDILIDLFRSSVTFQEREGLTSVDLKNLTSKQTILIIDVVPTDSAHPDELTVELFNILSKIYQIVEINQRSPSVAQAIEDFWGEQKNTSLRNIKEVLTELNERLRTSAGLKKPKEAPHLIIAVSQLREDIEITLFISKIDPTGYRKKNTRFNIVFMILALLGGGGYYAYQLDQKEKERQAQELKLEREEEQQRAARKLRNLQKLLADTAGWLRFLQETKQEVKSQPLTDKQIERLEKEMRVKTIETDEDIQVICKTEERVWAEMPSLIHEKSDTVKPEEVLENLATTLESELSMPGERETDTFPVKGIDVKVTFHRSLNAGTIEVRKALVAEVDAYCFVVERSDRMYIFKADKKRLEFIYRLENLDGGNVKLLYADAEKRVAKEIVKAPSIEAISDRIKLVYLAPLLLSKKESYIRNAMEKELFGEEPGDE